VQSQATSAPHILREPRHPQCALLAPIGGRRTSAVRRLCGMKRTQRKHCPDRRWPSGHWQT